MCADRTFYKIYNNHYVSIAWMMWIQSSVQPSYHAISVRSNGHWRVKKDMEFYVRGHDDAFLSRLAACF